MNDLNQVNEDSIESTVDELSLLKQRARMMGIQFSNNIGLESLKLRIAEKREESEEMPLPQRTKAVAVETPLKTMQREQMKLVRLRITNLDPKKKDLHGEIITVGNDVMGKVSKFVPFGEVTENGYHVPYCIYTDLKARKFLHIRATKHPRTGEPQVEQKLVPEFALEVLPQLTAAELGQLAAQQAANGGVD